MCGLEDEPNEYDGQDTPGPGFYTSYRPADIAFTESDFFGLESLTDTGRESEMKLAGSARQDGSEARARYVTEDGPPRASITRTGIGGHFGSGGDRSGNNNTSFVQNKRTTIKSNVTTMRCRCQNIERIDSNLPRSRFVIIRVVLDPNGSRVKAKTTRTRATVDAFNRFRNRNITLCLHNYRCFFFFFERIVVVHEICISRFGDRVAAPGSEGGYGCSGGRGPRERGFSGSPPPPQTPVLDVRQSAQ